MRKKFAISLKNRFSVLQDNTEVSIHNFNQAIEEKKEEWIRDTTLTKIEDWMLIERRLLKPKSPRLKERLSTEYTMKDKEVKRSCRSDKRHIDDLAIEVETAARNNDMRTLYKTTKKIRGDYGTSQDKPVRTTDGWTVKGERESTGGKSISRQFSTGQYHCKLQTFLRVTRTLTFPQPPLQ